MVLRTLGYSYRLGGIRNQQVGLVANRDRAFIVAVKENGENALPLPEWNIQTHAVRRDSKKSAQRSAIIGPSGKGVGGIRVEPHAVFRGRVLKDFLVDTTAQNEGRKKTRKSSSGAKACSYDDTTFPTVTTRNRQVLNPEGDEFTNDDLMQLQGLLFKPSGTENEIERIIGNSVCGPMSLTLAVLIHMAFIERLPEGNDNPSPSSDDASRGVGSSSCSIPAASQTIGGELFGHDDLPPDSVEEPRLDQGLRGGAECAGNGTRSGDEGNTDIDGESEMETGLLDDDTVLFNGQENLEEDTVDDEEGHPCLATPRGERRSPYPHQMYSTP
ncbi:hypothetical protein HK102_008968, partial [Quaeritorhiza haematococci]